MAGSTDNTFSNPGKTARTAGIILAAGTGSRMGRTKQLLPFKGRPLLAHVVEQGVAAGLSPLILVLGHRAGDIQAQISGFSVDIVINRDYQSGMASSIRRGLERLVHTPGGHTTGALFLLGDQPLVDAATIQRILAQARIQPGKIIIPTFQGRRGNPVYFDSRFFDQLRQLSGDTGGREIFKKFSRAVHELPVHAPGICLDIDTPEDYEHLKDKEKTN